MPYFGIPIRNGLPIGLGSVAGFGIAPFSPESLFENGEVGAWYDPSDYSTLFTDSAGTTPVTGVEQFVGLMLDKSQGLVLGSELVTNGTFASGTGWTLTNGASISGGQAVIATTSSFPSLQQSIVVSANKLFQVTVDVISISGTLQFIFWDGASSNASNIYSTTTTGTKTFYFLTTATTASLVIGRGLATTSGGTIDNISVRELPGNHAFQTSSAKRPKLAARYNLLTYSEEFDNGVWFKVRSSAANTTATTDPIGGNTADKLTEDTQTGAHYVSNLSTSFTFQATSYTWSCYIKAAERGFAVLGTGDTGGETGLPAAGICIDLSNGTVTATNGTFSSQSVTAVGNGWYRASITVLGTAATGRFWVAIAQNGTSASINSVGYTGDNTSGIYIWGADLRPASQATGAIGPAYQRVAAATVYDTAGFLPYLAFDGLDDSMSTNSIDFSAGDKMTVWAGVRKLADSQGSISELSSNVNTNNGVFGLFVGFPALTSTQWFPKGTSGSSADYTAAAPLTTVLTGIGDISGDVSTLRENGTQVATSSSDQGTGNYGNYPLYIGARNNASIFFNGWLTSLIVRGAQSTQSQIEATEAWVNGKTGAY